MRLSSLSVTFLFFSLSQILACSNAPVARSPSTAAPRSCTSESLSQGLEKGKFTAYQSSEGVVRNYAFAKDALSEIETNVFLNPSATNLAKNSDSFQQKKQALEAMFKTVKHLMKEVINSSKTFSPKLKRSILARVNKIEMTLENSSPSALGAGPWYDPQHHQVMVPTSLFESPPSAWVTILAHEIAHSFDSDNIRLSLISDGHGQKMNLVLNPQDDAHILAIGFPLDESRIYDLQLQCLKSLKILGYHKVEAWPDLISSKVFANYLKRFIPADQRANEISRGLMSLLVHGVQGGFDVGDDHRPSPRSRIETLFLGNPALNSMLTCTDVPVQASGCQL